jgi:hypothetical protein
LPHPVYIHETIQTVNSFISRNSAIFARVLLQTVKWRRRRCSTNGDRLLPGNKSLGRPRRRRVDNIKMDLGKIGWGDVNWIGLAKDRNRWRAVVNSVLNLRVP